MNDAVTDLDSIVRQSLEAFARRIAASAWYGKEREAVSLYAFGTLVHHCREGSPLFDPAQIGIEVRVPKPKDVGVKREVCKDLVVWPEPGWTCWSAPGEGGRLPLAVMEWKVNERRERYLRGDVEWLESFCRSYPGVIGYAVAMEHGRQGVRLRCTRVTAERTEPGWLDCEAERAYSPGS